MLLRVGTGPEDFKLFLLMCSRSSGLTMRFFHRSRLAAKSSPRDPFAKRAARLVRRILWLLFFIALAGGGSYFARLTHSFIYHSDFFTVRDIDITGASDALEQDARRWLAQYLSGNGENLCRLDGEYVAHQLTRLPRALEARTTKSYPQTLRIRFQERRPLMIANLDRPYLVDRDGVLLAQVQPVGAQQFALPMLTGLPYGPYRPGKRLAGERLTQILHAADFIKNHDEFLQPKIVEWNLNGREEVTAILRGGAEVRFGRNPPLELLDKLNAVLIQKPKIEQATYIDLRIERQVVYR
jgi:hypothetical protein